MEYKKSFLYSYNKTNMVSNPTQLTLYAEWLKVRFITQVKINIHRINQLFCFVVSGASSPLLLFFFYTPPLFPGHGLGLSSGLDFLQRQRPTVSKDDNRKKHIEV